jgi:hypothetical protein
MHPLALDLSSLRFRTSEEVFDALRAACEAKPGFAAFEVIGHSEEGRPLAGVTLGRGPRLVTLVAGAHADEPVGPETLRALVLAGLDQPARWGDLLERFTFRLVPHVNPDAEMKNRAWIERWPDVGAYLAHRLREPPGRDVEFGYPALRVENQAASRFLFDYRPVALHASLHGMAFAEGALLLIEKDWAERVGSLRRGFAEAAAEAGLRLHDEDRGGDKGFRYYGPGFWSTPEGQAMRAHFLAAGDEATAAQFAFSSMEWAGFAGRDPATGLTPLCLVTELPLFHLAAAYNHAPGVPALYHRLQDALPELTLAARHGEDLTERLAPYDLRPLDLETAVDLQLRLIALGLETIDETADRGRPPAA